MKKEIVQVDQSIVIRIEDMFFIDFALNDIDSIDIVPIMIKILDIAKGLM